MPAQLPQNVPPEGPPSCIIPVEFPGDEEYVQALLGVLAQLASPDYWQYDGTNKNELVALWWNQWLQDFEIGDCPP